MMDLDEQRIADLDLLTPLEKRVLALVGRPGGMDLTAAQMAEKLDAPVKDVWEAWNGIAQIAEARLAGG